jgi:hypothetical protein
MKITTESISKLNPCKDRFDNFTLNYPNFNGSLKEFLSLENITYDDKVWVVVRLMSKNQRVRWSIMCAESVKHFYEEKYLDSKALSNLFDYLNSIEDFENLTEVQRAKILSLRNAAYAAAAADAAAAYDVVAAREEQQDLNLLFLTSVVEE